MKLARARWPSIALSDDRFEAHLDRLEVADGTIAQAGEDLAFAFACASGSRGAIEELDRELKRQLTLTRRRFRVDDDSFAEIIQIARIKLLSSERPRIALYAGSGPLGAWLRMVVIRIILDHLRRQNEDGTLGPGGSVATAVMQSDLALDEAAVLPKLRESMEAVVGALSSDDRLLLKLHYLDGTSLEALAKLLGVHRATVVRRIAALRRALLADLGGRMHERYGMRPSEFGSVWRSFGQEVQLTLSRLLTA